MSEILHEMLAFVLENDAGLTKGKARSVASYFADTESFQDLTREDLSDIRGVGRRKTVTLTNEEIERVLSVREHGYIDPSKSVPENFLSAISRDFTKRQIDMIRGLTLDNLNPNPFLIKTLNLHTPEEVVKLNVYMVSTRSIVTSMGFFVEKLLLASSETVEKGPRGSGWDLVKTSNGEKHWIQVKSGPNDMDKDQIVYWSDKIQEKLSQDERAYIGITYGKRSNETVTFGIMKQLLPDWEMKTLIGRELWDFVSDDPEYHERLFDILRESAVAVLITHSICEEIEACVERVIQEFINKYGEGEEGVSNYLTEIF